ncbi:MAG: ATP-binding protein [Saprospiraceae bacterium]|nr:ATP-binding protein [Saprospiraceae bacterium]MBP6566580.1 ATP-binding protein [Saprospiraceae bacterium]
MIEKKEKLNLLNKVFSPTAPIKEENFFRGRIDQLKRIVSVMNEDGQHVILFGERGVGKTSMANISQKHITNLFSVKVTCSSEDTFNSLWNNALSQVQFSRTISGIGFKPQEKNSLVDLSNVLRAIEDMQPYDVYNCLSQFPMFKFLFIFDEFDNIKSQHVRSKFADLIKSLSDNSTNIKIMIVGIAENVINLIGNHQSLERCLMQIRMPRMSEPELLEIIQKGCDEVEMEMTKQVQNKIISFSSGFPHYTHLLSKFSLKNAIEKDQIKVKTENLDFAINLAIENAAEHLRESYRMAVFSESGNNKWQNVIFACAKCYSDQFNSFTVEDIIQEYQNLVKKECRIEDIQNEIEALCDKERGFFLEKQATESNTRFKFANPMMKPFILLNIEAA